MRARIGPWTTVEEDHSMLRIAIVTLAAVVSATLAPHGVRAQVVSLETLLTEADSANARVAAARASADAAAARIPQAGVMPDPTLGLALMNIPVADPSLSREMMTMTQIQLGARLPWPDRLALGESIASSRSEAATWEVRRVRDEVRSEVSAAFHELYFVDRALEVTARNRELLADLADLTSSRYAVGDAGQPDVLRAQVELTRLTDQAVALRERRVSAVARLNTLVGRASDTPIPSVQIPEQIRRLATERAVTGPTFSSSTLVDVAPTDPASPAETLGSLPSVPSLRRRALEESPTIRAHMRRVAAEETALALAEKGRLPDFNVSLGYAVRSGSSDFVSLSVSAPIPIFAQRRQEPAIREQAAVLEEHRAMHASMVDELDREITSLSADLRRAGDQLTLLEQGILPQARTGLAASTASYQVGSVDFLTLLDAQVTLYRHELDYHRLLADFATTLAALERAVGTEILP